jgi:DNA polymerase-3 subunit epsilon
LSERLSVDIPADLRHTALGDAVATADVLTRLLPMLLARGIDSFGQVLTQVRRHQNIVQDLNN